ncbi:dentin sialophosphoprotein [Musca domestica]|uniref:Dentin sialophosphoprotein n=1 Tax=Musca domestica TaxID=7370 RepID=A0A1I8MR92_MUSDO|nr:dentin sialophosphoprotein [Musca domestica]
MKFVLLLCVLSVLLLQQTYASPVKLVERQERAVGRQQATSGAVAAAPAVDDDDDDEDDDDDDTDLGDLIEDDDDDEDDDDEEDDDEEEDDTPQGQAAPAASSDDDDEEDDDDDDYLDRLFDDILGDDEEEDDDDDEDTASSVQNTIAAQPAAPIEDLAPAAASSANTGISDGVDLPVESGNAADTLSEGNAADIAPASSSNQNEGALTGDDDEADDEDEDDDDDDIIGDDVIEARREARELKNNIIDMTSDAFQERNNQFVDAIFARINRIVSDNYDPFVVQLTGRSAAVHDVKHNSHTTGSSSSTKTAIPNRTKEQQITHKTKATKPQTANTSIKKLKNTKSEPRSTSTNTDNIESLPKDNQEYEKAKLQLQLEQLQAQQPTLKATKQIENNVSDQEEQKGDNTAAAAAVTETAVADNKVVGSELRPETRTVHTNEVVKSGNQKKASTKAHKQNANKKAHNGNSAASGTAASGTKAANNNNNKQKLKSTIGHKNGNSPQHGGKDGSGDFQKAEGSLSGLASLKRVGNVKVVTDPEGRNSTIKAKFTLGPLILRVEKSFKRGGVENVKSATARTNEMIGRIKFGVVNDRATLMSIKVQQPKQVEVESKDNHDRTREFVWRRTPKIAKLVNEKLKMAAETFFAPQGVEVVRL